MKRYPLLLCAALALLAACAPPHPVTLAPTASAPGLAIFQPFDGTSFAALDVIEQAYTVSGGAVAVSGMPTTLLHVPGGSMTGYPFFTDPTDRLWVAVPGTATTTYVVLARKS